MCPHCNEKDKQSVLKSFYKSKVTLSVIKCLNCGMIYEDRI